MEANQAAEHLQTIRTLMERSALYRRALAPIMTSAGIIGIAAAGLGCGLRITSTSGFIGYWLGVALGGIAVALLLVRRQALKSAEPFWSPPTRRVTQALSPPLTVGLLVGIWFLIVALQPPAGDLPAGMTDNAGRLIFLPAVWATLYGCALHAAGFFTSRGLRFFGWIFIASGVGVLFWMLLGHRQDYPDAAWQSSHLLMGVLFGLLQLAAGLYLYLTEKRGNES